MLTIKEAADRPVVVHGVRHLFFPLTQMDAWPGGEVSSRLVLIVQGSVSETWCRQALELIAHEVRSFEGAGPKIV